jgi:hypothetical protein
MQIMPYMPGIVLVIGVILITVHFYHMISVSKEEGFTSIEDAISTARNSQTDKPPTADQMASIYKSLLLYIKSDFSKGLLYVNDLNKRIYGKSDRVGDDFDPRKLLDDYKNPITGL